MANFSPPPTTLDRLAASPPETPASFTRAQWLTLTMLADLLESREELSSEECTSEASREWLDNKIAALATECRLLGLHPHVDALCRMYQSRASLLACCEREVDGL